MIQQYSKKKPFFLFRRSVLISLGLVLVLMAVASFFYLYSLERQLHANSDQVTTAKKLITGGLPEEPFNMLLMGNDTRGEDDPGRADTIMILRVNPKDKSAALISIPRDFRVKIPGYGKNKINAAYTLGGTSLTTETVESYSGMEIDHYALVDFHGFEDLVDTLGGIDIYVEKRLYDPAIKLDLSPGYQHVDGETALKYVRFRKDKTGDFGRIERQQQFLKAVMKKGLTVRSVIKLPTITKLIAKNTDTDLTISEMLALGRLFKSFDDEDVEMISLPGEARNIGGVSYVVPEDEEVAQIFYKVENNLALDVDVAEEIVEEVPVEILNGSGTSGLASRVAKEIEAHGFIVSKVGNADNYSYTRTKLSYDEDYYREARRLQALIGRGELVAGSSDSLSPVKISVVLGKDSVTTNSGNGGR